MRKFKDFKVGEKFEAWGDVHLNYVYPALCVCIKIDDSTGQEIFEDGKTGISFIMSPNDEVFEHDADARKVGW